MGHHSNKGTDNQGTDTRRGVALVLMNLIGQLGPILGTNIFQTHDAPRYIKGMGVCAGFMFFVALVALVQH